MKTPLIIAVSMTIIACQTTRSSSAVGFEHSFVDDISQRQILISYKNKSNRSICLSPVYWPNKHGFLSTGGDLAQLVVAGNSYPMVPNNGGYCPGCATEVRPGQEIKGAFPYSVFELPEELYTEEKQLYFEPGGDYCEDLEVK